MRILSTGFVIIALGSLGCARESPKGGPGASPNPTTTSSTSRDGDKTTTTTTTTATTEPTDRTQTFSVKVPTETNVKQGSREEVTVTLNRGSNFKEPVTVKFQAPAGIKVTPDSVTLQGDDAKTKVVVEAMENAAEGHQSITVVGVPKTGQSTSVTMRVDVKKKS